MRTMLLGALLVSHAAAQTPLGVDLLINGDGEDADAALIGTDNGKDVYELTHWTVIEGVWAAQETGWYDIAAFSGDRFLRPTQEPLSIVVQDVSLDLGPGTHHATARAAIRNWDDATDAPELRLAFLDAGGDVIDEHTTGVILTQQWGEHVIIQPVPPTAATARVLLRVERLAGAWNDGYFDEVELMVTDTMPLVPMFEMTVTPGTFPVEVEFEDITVGNVVSRLWEFGDDTQSTEASPTHLYDQAGVFDVALTVTWDDGAATTVRNGAVAVAGPDIVKGPYLQNVTQDAMTIMWETGAEATSEVDYQVDGQWVTVVDDDPKLIHEMRLEGFAPGQQVPYVVRSTVGELVVESDEFTFTTAPPDDTPFRLIVWGDNQDNPDVFSQLVAGMQAFDPDLLFALGDVVSTGGIYEQWDSRFLGPLRPLISTVPFFVSIGNHEQNAHWFYDFLDQPGKEHWFAFTYSDVRFVVIDTNFPFAPGSTQYEWLKEELQSEPSQQADWLFTMHHHPPYSEIWEEQIYEDLRSHLVPLFVGAGVDMDFHGHIHDYERGVWHPGLTNRRIGNLQTSGGGGELWWDGFDGEWDQVEKVVQYVYHFCALEIGDDHLQLKAIDIDGNEFDLVSMDAEPRPKLGIPEPTPATGEWRFTDELNPAFGTASLWFLDGDVGQTEAQTEFGTTELLDLPDIDGQVADVMAFPKATDNTMGFVVSHDAPPNGYGDRVNEYSIVMDLLILAESFGADAWLALHQTDTQNASDAEAYVRLYDGGIGIEGQYHGNVQPDTWHRIALVFRSDQQGKTFLTKYIDGEFVGYQRLAEQVDGRYSIAPGTDPNGLLLMLTENDADSTAGVLSSMLFIDRPLNPYEIEALGGADAAGIVVSDCPADVNTDGELNVLDFVAFQMLWADEDPAADCDADANLTILDFVCFQQLFVAGCD